VVNDPPTRKNLFSLVVEVTGAAIVRSAVVGIVVQKYGGSSVADAEGIKRVARRVVEAKKAGNQVVVVVSAMGDTTDELIDLANQVSPVPPARELDMLLTAGERISMAVLAMAIQNLGHEARSFTGSQAGVITDAEHGRAKIIDVTPGRIEGALADGAIAIVAGFQGVSQTTKDITTLGRGGSDTTAVALAVALRADVCEIYSDVDGIFSADPRIEPRARKVPRISYEETLEMAAQGAKILHLRCVEYARRYDMPIHVRSSFSDKEGTWVVKATDVQLEGSMEAAIITGVAHDRSQAKITVVGVPDKPGEAAALFRAVADAAINIDMIVQNVSAAATSLTDISFTLPRGEGQTAMTALSRLQDSIGFESLQYDDSVGKVSIIGAGMSSSPGITARFFEALSDAGVNIGMISTSEIRVSVVVAETQVEDAVRAAHAAFNLGSDEVEAVVYGGTGR
jgi:aspartate kinase